MVRAEGPLGRLRTETVDWRMAWPLTHSDLSRTGDDDLSKDAEAEAIFLFASSCCGFGAREALAYSTYNLIFTIFLLPLYHTCKSLHYIYSCSLHHRMSHLRLSWINQREFAVWVIIFCLLGSMHAWLKQMVSYPPRKKWKLWAIWFEKNHDFLLVSVEIDKCVKFSPSVESSWEKILENKYEALM